MTQKNVLFASNNDVNSVLYKKVCVVSINKLILRPQISDSTKRSESMTARGEL